MARMTREYIQYASVISQVLEFLVTQLTSLRRAREGYKRACLNCLPAL